MGCTNSSGHKKTKKTQKDEVPAELDKKDPNGKTVVAQKSTFFY